MDYEAARERVRRKRHYPNNDPNIHMPMDTKYIYLFDIAEWGLS